MKSGNLLIIIAMILVVSGCKTESVKEGIVSYELLKARFEDPPSEYRSAPLWDWNDDISEEGIDFQMKEFKKAGIGGVFVHPRPGLITEYLSEEWFRLFDYTIQKGKELDMKVWIYDENSYPSGFAGGHVPAEMPDSYRHGAGLKMEVQEKLNIIPSDTIEAVLKKNGDGFADVTAAISEETGKDGPYYVFRKTYPGKSPWYGGFTYVDLLYPGVTEKFLELTMTKGYERNKADFGLTLPGVFTDEPNLEAAMSEGAFMRWTPDLREEFQKRWGYDLWLHLPSLALETGDWKRVRHNYYVLILELFIDRWAKPWSKYCDENNLLWTGHYWEHGWPEPTEGIDEAAFYIWHQQPGVDMLGNRLDSAGLGGQFGNDRAIRELLSAANQAGRTRTLSETYGGGGWEMGFTEQKRLADWQAVLGVNFVNQHLSYYTLKGVRKFDYPPSFSYHEPWWKHYKLMGDYIGRISMALSSGEQINETLVLQPNTTAWMYFSRKERNPVVNEIRVKFKNFIYQLEQQHIEYDLGSEYVIRTLGSTANGKLTLGKRTYNLVVIPAEMENLDRQTLDILKKYLTEGGKILSFRSQLPYIDGQPSSEGEELFKTFPNQWTVSDNLKDPAVLSLLSRGEFSLDDQTQNGMLYHQRRILSDGQLIFTVNSHKDKPARASITVKGKHVVRLDPMTGEVYSYPSKRDKGKVTFDYELDPAGSALFVVTNKKTGDPVMGNSKPAEMQVTGESGLKVSRTADNVLMINYLDLKTSGTVKRDIYFMNALESLFRENGVSIGNPWQHKIQYKKDYLQLDTLFGPDTGFEASYHFEVSADLTPEALKSIRAVVERPELWTVSINGQPVEKTADDYWIDRDFPLFPVGEHLKPGKNTLTLSAPRMHIMAAVMPVYITGDFLVVPADKGFRITGGKIETTGSWREAGHPFYPFGIQYSGTYNLKESGIVRLKNWNGSIAEVYVNGKSAGTIFTKPCELDISGFIVNGPNEIAVEVTGSLKNTFGFFYRDNNSWIFGPHSWNYAPAEVPAASQYYLIDYGLFEPFEVLTSDN
jgi:hypothetical protein